jgi:hypothetical protein
MISEVRILKELRPFFSEVRIAKELANRELWAVSRQRGDIVVDLMRHTRESIAREYQLAKFYAVNGKHRGVNGRWEGLKGRDRHWKETALSSALSTVLTRFS